MGRGERYRRSVIRDHVYDILCGQGILGVWRRVRSVGNFRRSQDQNWLWSRVQVVCESWETPRSWFRWSKFAHIASSDGRLTLFVLCFLPGSLSLSPRASMMKQHGCLNVPSLDFRQNTLHILTTQEVLTLEKNEIQWQWMTCQVSQLSGSVSRSLESQVRVTQSLCSWWLFNAKPSVMIMADLNCWAFRWDKCSQDFHSCTFQILQIKTFNLGLVSLLGGILVIYFFVTNSSHLGDLTVFHSFHGQE